MPLMDETILHLKEYIKHFHSDYDRESHLFYTVIHGVKGQMSCDNVACFLKKYALELRADCPDIPENMHAHLFRHSRAMHLYQSGIPLSYIRDFLGHVSMDTTSIYASADMTMIRNALEQAVQCNLEANNTAVWKDDEDIMLRLCGLK
jgi:integrase/recombinase XerD